jgi:hypothetical protein
MRNLASGMMGVAGGPLGMVAGAYDAGSRMMGGQGLNLGASQPDALNNIVNSYGYFEDDTDPEGTKESYLNSLSQAVYGRNYEDATTYLGVEPTFRKGFKPGEIDPKTGGTYNIYGQSENDDGSVSYSSFSAAGRGFSAMASSGFMGGVADAQRVSTSLTASPKDKARAQAYLDVIGKEEKTSGLIADKKAKEEEAEKQKAIAEKAKQDKIEAAKKQAEQERLEQLQRKREAEIASNRRYQAMLERQRQQQRYQRDDGGNRDDGSQSAQDQGAVADQQGGMFTAKGGFIKKPKPKVKKMKRGGLASR